MELKHEFRVGVPVEQAWGVLLDVERIAPCLPGAELQEVQGEEYRGAVKVKVGPITAQYKGKATFLERDEAARKAVLRAEGRETRGQGNASATITATLTAEGDETVVAIDTELTVTGRVAQLGRGVLADVSAKLLNEFVSCLETSVLSSSPSKSPDGQASTGSNGSRGTASAGAARAGAETQKPEAVPAPADAGAAQAPVEARRIEYTPAQPIDLLGTAGAPLAKRLVPLAIAAVIILLLGRRLARRR